MEPSGLEQGSLHEVYLPYLPEQDELDRLDALLTEMLAKSQAELDRLAPHDRV
jgi:hypothetical protein